MSLWDIHGAVGAHSEQYTGRTTKASISGTRWIGPARLALISRSFICKAMSRHWCKLRVARSACSVVVTSTARRRVDLCPLLHTASLCLSWERRPLLHSVHTQYFTEHVPHWTGTSVPRQPWRNLPLSLAPSLPILPFPLFNGGPQVSPTGKFSNLRCL